MREWMSKIRKEHLALLAIIVVLIALRLPALEMPYYQDENDWASIVAEGSPTAGGIPHPPLSEAIYIATDRIFGNDNLRMTPFLLSIVNVVLLFVVVRYRWGVRAALWAASLFTISYYSILASIVVDTDGQVLPFFFLIATIAYYRWQDALTRKKKWIWGAVFLVTMVAGLLTKLGFIVAFGAFILDFLYTRRKLLDLKKLVRYGGTLVAFVVGVTLLMLASQPFFPQFNLALSVKYWEHFIVFDRNLFQTGIQVVKSIMFTSPLLLALPFLLSRESNRKLTLFPAFLIAGCLFYIVAFDFSGAALDRYFQFVVVPLSVMGGVAIAGALADPKKTRLLVWILATLSVIVLLAVQFLPHFVPALHPKSEWLSRLVGLRWDFLFPFTGGSGPMGFYVSFLMIALAFIGSVVVTAAYFFKRLTAKVTLIILMGIGLTYNASFIEEYLVGAVNGNGRTVMDGALTYIENTPEIEKVITYNDIGFYELSAMGKYQRRLYADPAFVASYVPILKDFTGHYLVVEMPRIDPKSMYSSFFATCEVLYRERSGEIVSSVYDCKNATLTE